MWRLILFFLISLWPCRAAVTYFGSASTPADNSAQAGPTVTITPPASMTTGDLVLVMVQYRASGSSDGLYPSTTGGQNWYSVGQATATNVSSRLWRCRFNGTWTANPVFSLDGGGTNGMSGVMTVFRPSATTKDWDLDVSKVSATFVAGTTPFTKTITGITTLTNGALAVAYWMSIDDNTWDSLSGTAGTWTNPGGQTQWRNTQSASNHSMAIAYQVTATAGATGDPSMNQATLGGDAGSTLIVSFYEKDMPTGGITADLWETAEFDTLTTGNLDSNDNIGTGSWALTGSITKLSQSTSGERATIGQVNSTSDTGTRGFAYDVSGSPGTVGQYATYTSASTHSTVSLGFWFKYPTSFDGTFKEYDLIHVTTAADTHTYIKLTNSSANPPGHTFLYLHNASAYSSKKLWVQGGTWYWLTMKLTQNGSSLLRAFTEDGAEVHAYGNTDDNGNTEVTKTPTNTVSNSPIASYTTAGPFGGDPPSAITGSCYWDDLVIDWTSATFPLGPGAAAAGSPAFRRRVVVIQ